MELRLADPASLAWALTATDSGAGPPLHRGWALGTTPARDLGRNVGGEKEEEGREKEICENLLRDSHPGDHTEQSLRYTFCGNVAEDWTGPTARSSWVTAQLIVPAPHGR